MRSFALLAGAFLLLSVAGLSSSSEADEPLFVRSAQQLERLWSGVLGCTHPEENDARPTFETTLENTGAPSAIDHDYVECGKRALRNASSRMLVNAIEDAVRSGGVALLDENFRLDSNLGLVLGETVTGSLDAVVPLPWIGNERFDGAEQALFLQPGLVFWPGLAGENRIDANLGLVYRTRLKEDVVAGGSAFYDYDLERGSRRFGLGADLQSGVLRAGLNYYIPLNRWREGRADYEEQPLQGGDFRLGLALPSARFDTSVGFWRLEGEDDVRTKWRPSLGFDAGFRISPGVFLEAGYERHNKDESIGSRWNTGLAVRFNLPGLDGVIAPSDSSFSPDLFKPVEREKRILYEEREAVPRIQLVPRRTGTSLQMLVEEGSTVTIAGELARLPVPVMLQLAIDDASTADLGGDFTYGHKVYEWDADTRQQRAPDTATECPAAMCAMVIPSGVTEFDIDLNILDDSEDKEIPEHIVLRVDVPSEYRRLVRGGETTVTIRAHGNTVEFASSSGTELMENGGTATVTVDVDLPPPAPITLQIETGGTARRGTDYRAPERLTIPAGADSVELTLTGIDNEISEGNKTILLTLSNNLPDGWEYTENGNVHAITLLDDDLSIGFTGSGNPTFVDEDDGTVELMVAANQSLPAAATVAWSVDLGGAVTAGDFTGSTGGNLSFQQGDGRNNPRTIILRLNNDTGPEDAEEVTVTLNEAGSSLPDGWSVGGSHTFTIDSNDGAITFADASTPLTINEGETRTVRVVSTAAGPRGGYPLRVSFSPSASGQIDFRESLSLPAGQDAATFDITVNRDDVPEEARTYTMSLGSGSSAPRGWTVSSTRTVTVPFSDGRISFANARITAAEGGSSVETTLVMDPPPASDTTISMSITGGAQEGTDYTRTVLVNGSNVAYRNGFVYPANAASVTFRVSAMEDTDRVNERAIYRITNFPAGYSAGANTSLQIDLNDNDIGDVQFATGLDVSAEEGEIVTLRVQASSAATADLNLRWSASPLGEFDLPSSGTVTVQRGSRDATFRVTIDNPDPPDPEAAEDVIITLSGSVLPAGWSLGSRTTHRINIPANDRRVTFSPTEAMVLESEKSYNLTLSLNDAAPVGGVPLRITVTRGSDSDITLSTSDTDKATWNAGTRTFTIQEGERSAVLQVAFLGDDDFNEDSYTLSFARGAGFPSNEGWEIANSSFQLTVNDPRDDTVQFASDNPTQINEGETITLGVVVSGGNPSSPLNLNWSLEDAGNDISKDSGSVTVSGVRTTFNVPTMGDMISELAESFTVTLSADNLPSGFSLGTRRTHGFTINPSDNTIKFASASGTVGEGDGTYNARVEVNLPNPGRISLNVTTGGSATRGSDYTVDLSVFVPANGSTMDIPVAIIDDSDFAEEDNETIELTIAGSSLPTGWKVVSPMTHTITITDNDSAPGGTFGFAASGNAATASEGDTVSLTVRSTAAPAAGSPISFNWSVSPSGEV
ncbi:MAG: inverse autotransporter beta domain-containing protein, partial [Hyphomicrobiales bacterium]|nr:inverse autotransporter beta domain-containing protein [Hyphomicrobiales bacterium]